MVEYLEGRSFIGGYQGAERAYLLTFPLSTLLLKSSERLGDGTGEGRLKEGEPRP